LRCRHDAELLPVDADEANRTDADLLVDSLVPFVVRMAFVDT
jgi:hypothetical protein